MNLPVKGRHIIILTGEPSGDMHAAELVRELKKKDPFIQFSGIGGPCLEQQGVELFFHISKLSAMGLTDVIKQFGQIKKAFSLFRNQLKTRPCHLLIVVDYPGFNLRAATYAKTRHSLPVLYYITPKIWAWNRSRIKKIRACVDHAALILPFEKKMYQAAGIPATYVGNPLMDEYPNHLTKLFISQKEADTRKGLTIGLLPGSRKSEIQRLLVIMLDTARLISREIKNVHFIISRSSAVPGALFDSIIDRRGKDIAYTISRGPVRDIFLTSDLVVAASGTVTLEAALCCVPTILVYKMSQLSYLVAKMVVKIKYAGLANLIVNQEVMPEYLQSDATPEKISQKALNMLDNLPFHENQLQKVRRFLGTRGASVRTASLVLEMLHSGMPKRLRKRELPFDKTKQNRVKC